MAAGVDILHMLGNGKLSRHHDQLFGDFLADDVPSMAAGTDPVSYTHLDVYKRQVLENAYDIIVTGEINGADTLEFKLPYSDPKRATLDNEKQVQIAEDVYLSLIHI